MLDPKAAVTNRGEVPGIRAVHSPLTAAMLAPLDEDCWLVQFADQLTDAECRELSKLLESRPTVKLRAYGDVPNLEFLKHFPGLRRFQVDEAETLEDISGLGYLSRDVESLGVGARLSRRLSLRVLRRFSGLRRLYLEGPVKDIDVIAELKSLQHLTLRSITLPDLEILTQLQELLSLEIKLGGTQNLSHLPSIGRLQYLELWMVRGLSDLTPISSVLTLEYLFLQALSRVDHLPPLDRLTNLRGVCLETMKGIHDLSPLMRAPDLEELWVIAMSHLQPDDFTCLVGHPTLKYASVGLGSTGKNDAVRRVLGLHEPPLAFKLRWQSAATA
ncbi:MAG: hypothetical protein M3Z28_09880 [Candidatus Dormibacteraeota bacterium]|nr:hypothetical protein [Candidatus Dormibacteraeota bacterium]